MATKKASKAGSTGKRKPWKGICSFNAPGDYAVFATGARGEKSADICAEWLARIGLKGLKEGQIVTIQATVEKATEKTKALVERLDRN